ncbi:MAG TPA: hypothetical protein VJB57_00715 [Dehalococcoidia bacterium]|nr:hypothetical protein [Dehalococcoidia bacterium]
MNALELIDIVRSYEADLVVEDKKLIVRGHGDRLPDDVRAALKENKAALMVALGAPYDVTLAEVLGEIRPYLVPALQRLPDSQLILLVNFSILHAFNRAMRDLEHGD